MYTLCTPSILFSVLYQIIERQNRVAFIGISNWALDPAKMNRGIMVLRGEPDLNELILSALYVKGFKETNCYLLVSATSNFKN